jgi:hypothetical protein
LAEKVISSNLVQFKSAAGEPIRWAAREEIIVLMSKNRSGSLTPFIFSRRYVYFLLAFLALSIVGPFLDKSFGLDFQSYPNITLGLGFPLTILFFLWISSSDLTL